MSKNNMQVAVKDNTALCASENREEEIETTEETTLSEVNAQNFILHLTFRKYTKI